MANQHEPFITLADAADYLGVSTKTVRRMISDRQLPAYRVGGQRGAIRLRLSEIDSALFPIGKKIA